NVSDFISIVEPSGVIRYSSPAVEALLGLEPANVIGMRFLDLVHPDDALAVFHFFATRREGNDASNTLALRLRHSSGAWRSFEVIAKGIVHDGRAALVATARDITARILLEKELE